MDKKLCAICGKEVEHGALQCPKCNHGIFETDKSPRATWLSEHLDTYTDAPAQEKRKGFLSRFFSSLFRRKNTCPTCGLDLSTIINIVHSSTPTTMCPQCNTDITNKLEFLDTRTEEEKEIELDAQSALTAEDEQLAKKLSYLSCQQDERDHTLSETKAEIRKLGMYLCANGGTNRMKKVAYRVQALGGDVRTLQIHWDGICGWMA